MLDGIGKRAAAPVLDAVHLAAFGLDEALVAVEHAGHLLALVRMDQEHDFIMTHCGFLMGVARANARRNSLPIRNPAVRRGLAFGLSRGRKRRNDTGNEALRQVPEWLATRDEW